MTSLPPNKKFHQRDAYYTLALQPIEFMTKSLRMGDGWELTDLEQFVNRCRALVAAFDARIEAAQNEGEPK